MESEVDSKADSEAASEADSEATSLAFQGLSIKKVLMNCHIF